MRHHSSICFAARFHSGQRQFPLGLLLELCPQLAVFHRLDRPHHLTFVLLESCSKFLLQFRNSAALSHDPFLPQFAALGFHLPRLLCQVALHLLEDISAAMQISD